jgi:ABC-type cobalamin/Fe3+-siderophores transport system ATPase subunit
MIEAVDLDFAYSGGTPVICGASLRLKRRAIGALIGANGCGKSTLIRLLVGLIRPLRGEIIFDAVPLDSVPPRELARRIAYVPQTTVMTFPFTALEVVLTGRSPYMTRFSFESAEDCEKARRALAAVGAQHLGPHRMTELSAGERQLVTVARALAQEPVCLLLDEPSASLDLKHRAALIRLLRLLRDQEGLTALVVTHDLQLLDAAFDCVFAMRSGAIVAQGRPSEVLCERVLAVVYDDPHVRVVQLEGRTFVWSES